MKKLLCLIAVCLFPLGSFALAADDLDQALAQLVARQKELLAKADRVESQQELEDLSTPFQKLIYDYEDLLKTHPDSAAVYVSYAMLLDSETVGEAKRAAALLLKANKLDPNIPLVKNQLGNFAAEEGRPLDALNYYLAAVELDPNEPLYHYQIGNLLTEARDDFVRNGSWSARAVDEAMLKAFAKAAELAPDRFDLSYRYAMAFYDLSDPQWGEALKVWEGLENRVKTPVEHQTLALHEAKVLGKLGRMDEARAKVEGVTEPVLVKQKEKLVAEWSDAAKN